MSLPQGQGATVPHPPRSGVPQAAAGLAAPIRGQAAERTPGRGPAVRHASCGATSWFPPALAARTRTAPSMRVAALISGGKDSCYNMMQCIAAGHQIVALANLRPAENQVGSDELDSYMYQTVGHHAIDLYAEAMALPLYRRTIRGRSLDTRQVYTKCEGDEVEDLYELLKLVKEKEEVEGISVGAILSDYQRIRVENVCKRLNLQPLAYLWQRNQEDLLREMISSNIQAMIIKVAALGLDPDKHLGKTLDQMEPYLIELSKKYGVHVCGEGGEYETFTLDCPLFKKKIIVDSSEVVIHSADAFAPVAYLRFLELHLEDKVSSVPDNYRTSNYIYNF
ncbi:diphthine--ammonia ligase isoform X2 [Gorilla gorilla gorilla]|uniref:diphthine--ammonia ligase isoform X2 n=1 Tax=Gorilla gorilla gorilla TaxID=9595 RepID=UPI002446488F|nr:diphthine--ammonia ligase isoform X4 [Gorilla gorilla gorilla]